jgi:hypothetical protein
VFVDAWSGKQMAADRSAPNQSMNLFQRYNRDVVGAPPVSGKPADIPENCSSAYYLWVPDTPYAAPAPGDVIVWGAGSHDHGSAQGHVGIFLRGDATGFDAFEANGDDPHRPDTTPRIRHHGDYGGVLGWLRPRQGMAPAGRP